MSLKSSVLIALGFLSLMMKTVVEQHSFSALIATQFSMLLAAFIALRAVKS
jgi:hypothetical protein